MVGRVEDFLLHHRVHNGVGWKSSGGKKKQMWGPHRALFKDIERQLAGVRQGEVKIPSYMDDIDGVICDWEGKPWI